jgi:hypothetical protein
MEITVICGKMWTASRLLLVMVLTLLWTSLWAMLRKAIPISDELHQFVYSVGMLPAVYLLPDKYTRRGIEYTQFTLTETGFRIPRISWRSEIFWEDVEAIEMKSKNDISEKLFPKMKLRINNRKKYLSEKEERKKTDGKESDYFILLVPLHELELSANEVYDIFIEYWEYNKSKVIDM